LENHCASHIRPIHCVHLRPASLSQLDMPHIQCVSYRERCPYIMMGNALVVGAPALNKSPPMQKTPTNPATHKPQSVSFISAIHQHNTTQHVNVMIYNYLTLKSVGGTNDALQTQTNLDWELSVKAPTGVNPASASHCISHLPAFGSAPASRHTALYTSRHRDRLRPTERTRDGSTVTPYIYTILNSLGTMHGQV
jgi:hypothetical protein